MRIEKAGQLLLVLCTSIIAVSGLVLRLSAAAAPAGTTEPGVVTGTVTDSDGAIAGATVRVRATENYTYTDAIGRFTLTGLTNGQEIEVTGWNEGYYIASVNVTPTISGVTLTLRPYHTSDHPDYDWTSPISGTSAKACGNCHPMIVSQWISNAHGMAVDNPRFYSLYSGTNLSGTAQVGSGYLQDFPGTAGNCANCHAPGRGVDGYLTTNMNDARHVITAGIHCDFCHKVGGVYLNPATGSVYPNAPGVSSQRLLRPPSGDDIFIGPYDDIPDPDTYLPLYRQSQYCAACHQFSFWGTPIYESYEEWLHSPYAERNVTCQDCHMPPNGDIYFALPAQGGLPHPPDTIPSHLQLGAQNIDLLQDAVTMTVSAHQIGRFIQATITITNTGAGHHFPTDFPGRHLILTIDAESEGEELTLREGPVVPPWGGREAGQPGTVYAKILADAVTGEAPVVSYWKPTQLIADNRIPAMGKETTHYLFAKPGTTPSRMTVTLRFRRAFQPLMDEKGWDSPDIPLAQTKMVLNPLPFWVIHLPLISTLPDCPPDA